MDNETIYTLEFLISRSRFAVEGDLRKHIIENLSDYIANVDFDIKSRKEYLILSIAANEKIIDACNDKLDFEREWAIRSRDDLSDFLREQAYPVLAAIETNLRNFIIHAMIDVCGFDWWDLFVPKTIRERVLKVEGNGEKSDTKFHHPIQLTFFEDLVKIFTIEFQGWADGHQVSPIELDELLAESRSIEEFREKLDRGRKKISFWADVFSNYFEDKKSWDQLEYRLIENVIPIRNRVMHHRFLRVYELRQLRECSDDVQRIINSAKTQLSEQEMKISLESIDVIRSVFENLNTDVIGKMLANMQIPDTNAMGRALANMQTSNMEVISRTLANMQLTNMDVIGRALANLRLPDMDAIGRMLANLDKMKGLRSDNDIDDNGGGGDDDDDDDEPEFVPQ